MQATSSFGLELSQNYWILNYILSWPVELLEMKKNI